ncbi:L,D-transpeptidase family protein [Catenuloplanes japonicus]|uniref:L,D-transpeptidase family protein n=1 Tax=Catenuloplanes japonicus TaxID=33876 RepID=UPI0012FC831E|nr:L,D-transpeptidase family protein [Catenuloplanes japonicus]
MTARGTARRAVVLGMAVAMAAGCGSDPVEPVSLPAPAPALPSVTPAPTLPDLLGESDVTTGPPAVSTAPPVTLPPSSRPPLTPSASPTPSKTAGATASPTPSPTPSGIPTAHADGVLERGETGAEITGLQERLTALGYWNGPADGRFGPLTQQAVYALQKAAGIKITGTVDAATITALSDGVRPVAKSRKGHRVEIDLTRQLLLIVDDGAVTKIFNTSTGTGKHYRYQGKRYLAKTPAGQFAVDRQVSDWRYGPRGPLYRPKYFTGGIAVHGAENVPSWPASDGCARVTIAAMDWIWKKRAIPVGTPVQVY